jgi:hypothetical protein
MEEGGRGHDIQSTVSYQHSLFFSFFFFDVGYYGSIMLAAMCCNTARHSVILARRGTLNGNGPGIGSGWAAAAGRLQ